MGGLFSFALGLRYRLLFFIVYIFESIKTCIRSMYATRTTSMGRGWVAKVDNVFGWMCGMGGWVDGWAAGMEEYIKNRAWLNR